MKPAFPASLLIAQSVQACNRANSSELYPNSAGNMCVFSLISYNGSSIIGLFHISLEIIEFHGILAMNSVAFIVVTQLSNIMVIGFNQYENYKIAMSKS